MAKKKEVVGKGITRSEQLEHLRNLPEDPLRIDVVVPTLQRMYHAVHDVHKRSDSERGVDVLIHDTSDPSETRHIGIVLKAGNIAGDAKLVYEIYQQIHMARTYHRPCLTCLQVGLCSEEIAVDEVWLLTGGELKKGAMDRLSSLLEKDGIRTEIPIRQGDWLWSKVFDYYPNYFELTTRAESHKQKVDLLRKSLISFHRFMTSQEHMSFEPDMLDECQKAGVDPFEQYIKHGLTFLEKGYIDEEDFIRTLAGQRDHSVLKKPIRTHLSELPIGVVTTICDSSGNPMGSLQRKADGTVVLRSHNDFSHTVLDSSGESILEVSYDCDFSDINLVGIEQTGPSITKEKDGMTIREFRLTEGSLTAVKGEDGRIRLYGKCPDHVVSSSFMDRKVTVDFSREALDKLDQAGKEKEI